MKLHRAESQPDWAKVSAGDQNFWQRTASASGGLVTPGNLITIIGVIMVIVGLLEIANHCYWQALLLLVVGRSLDVVDGIVADITGTKSALGEKLDAGFDKLGTCLTLIAYAVYGLAPIWLLVLLTLPHAVNTIVTLTAVRQGREIHPSRAGKTSMALAWASLVAFLTLRAAQMGPGSLWTFAVYFLSLISVVLGGYASAGYLLGWD